MVFVSLFSGFVPLASLGDMTSIGTLLAFVIVCVAVMIMRRTHPELPRPYKTPLVPLVPILGIVVCLAMMLALDVLTWIRLVVWLDHRPRGLLHLQPLSQPSRDSAGTSHRGNDNQTNMTTSMTSSVIVNTSLPGIDKVASGKVRDVYSVGENLLIVATDRISAFDCILPQGIPGKGRVLTQMSLFWFDFLRDVVANHLIAADVKDYPGRTASVRRSARRPFHAGAAAAAWSRLNASLAATSQARAGKMTKSQAPSAAFPCPPGCAKATNSRSRSSPRPVKPKPATMGTFPRNRRSRDRRRNSKPAARPDAGHLLEGS